MDTQRELELKLLQIKTSPMQDRLAPEQGEVLHRYLEYLQREEPEIAEVMALHLKLQLPPRPRAAAEVGARWLEIPDDLLAALAASGLTSPEALSFWSKRELSGLPGVKRADVAVIEEALKAVGGELRPSQKILKKRLSALLARSGWRALLKPVDTCDATWAFGFLHHLRLSSDEGASKILAHPMSRFLRDLKIVVPEADALEALLEAKPPLKALTIHRHPWWPGDNITGDLRRWLEALPLLEELEVHGSDLYLSSPIEAPALRALILDSAHRLPRVTLRALLGSAAPRLKALTLRGLADNAVEVLLEFSPRLNAITTLDLRENHLSPASVERLHAAIPQARLSDQKAGTPPSSTEVPEDPIEGLPDLSALNPEQLIALLSDAPSPLEWVTAAGHEAWRADRRPLLKLARALPNEAPRKGPLLLAALDAGEPFKLRVDGAPPTSIREALRGDDLEMARPARLPLRRWDAALEQLFAVDCLERVAQHALPYEAEEYARGYGSSLCDPTLLDDWDVEIVLDHARQRALGQLPQADWDLTFKRLTNLEEASQLYESHMWEGTEYDGLDSERDEMTAALHTFGVVNAGLQALLYADETWALGAATRAIDVREHLKEDAEAERAWQWRRLLGYALDSVEALEARVALLPLSDPRGYTREVCRLWAIARHEGDQEALRRAEALSLDPRFSGGRWSILSGEQGPS